MKRIRSLIVLTLTLVLILAISIPSAPIKAAGETLTLSISVGTVGQEVLVTGAGFESQYTVNLYFGRNPGSNISYTSARYSYLKTIAVSGGAFNTSFFVPSHLDGGSYFDPVTSGTYYVFATYHTSTGDTTAVMGQTAFKVMGGNLVITPNTGPPGTEVILTETSTSFFGSESLQIEFDGGVLSTLGTPTADASGMVSNLKQYIPSSTAGVHALELIGQTSGYESGALFTVTPALIIRPEQGSASSSITVSGLGFSGQSAFTLNRNGASLYQNTTEANGSFTYTFPPNTFDQGTHVFSVTDSNGNTAQLEYSIYDTTVNLEPSEGAPAGDVEITGGGFKAEKTVTISFEGIADSADVTVKTDEDGNFTTAFSVPWKNMGTYDVEVTDGENTKTAQFKVTMSSAIYPLTNMASPGSVGTDISIAGADFLAGRTLTVTFDGTTVATSTVPADGIFGTTEANEVSFKAPAAAGGFHTIEATDGTNVIKYGFYIETVPPATPAIVAPLSGEKADAQAFFDWDDVTDDSGLTYTLQVATAQDFSQASMVHEERNLTVSEFLLPGKLNTAQEGAPYYWRVQAIDLAGNEGAWTTASSFNVGFAGSLPQWAIYVIIVVAALGLSVFTFWLGRKTAYY
jgi:hypothetical protein